MELVMEEHGPLELKSEYFQGLNRIFLVQQIAEALQRLFCFSKADLPGIERAIVSSRVDLSKRLSEIDMDQIFKDISPQQQAICF